MPPVPFLTNPILLGNLGASFYANHYLLYFLWLCHNLSFLTNHVTLHRPTVSHLKLLINFTTGFIAAAESLLLSCLAYCFADMMHISVGLKHLFP